MSIDNGTPFKPMKVRSASSRRAGVCASVATYRFNAAGIKIMNALEVSQRSTDAWNRHDADALVALYAEEGTYHNPRLDHALTGQAIGDFAKSVWAAYPDMSLEIISRGTLEGAWSPFSGCYTEPTPVRLWTAPRLPVAPSRIRGLPSLGLRAIRFARSTHTLTGRR